MDRPHDPVRGRIDLFDGPVAVVADPHRVPAYGDAPRTVSDLDDRPRPACPGIEPPDRVVAEHRHPDRAEPEPGPGRPSPDRNRSACPVLHRSGARRRRGRRARTRPRHRRRRAERPVRRRRSLYLCTRRGVAKGLRRQRTPARSNLGDPDGSAADRDRRKPDPTPGTSRRGNGMIIDPRSIETSEPAFASLTVAWVGARDPQMRVVLLAPGSARSRQARARHAVIPPRDPIQAPLDQARHEDPPADDLDLARVPGRPGRRRRSCPSRRRS